LVRRLATLCFALLVLLGGPLPAAAQDGSPVAGGPSGPAVGTAVSWIGNEGTELAQVTVTEVTDPFQDYDPNSPPQRGFHFVLLAVTVDNTGAVPVTVDPNAFNLVDADGFVARTSYLYRSADVTAADPDLQYAELAPGASVSGVVGFQLLNGAEVERILFAPDSSRLITLVDERAVGIPLGTDVSYLGPEGAEVGEVTVNQLVDPFQDYDPSSPPERGTHYVVLELTVTNTGTRPLAADPGAFYLLDAQGFLAYPSYLYRTDATNPPDFQYNDALAPGESQSGIIAYQLLNGTEIAAVIFTPNYGQQQIIVGEPGAAGSSQAGPQSTPSSVEPPEEPTKAAAASPEDCEGIERWALEMVGRLTQLPTIVGPISALENQPNPTIDPVATREIADQLQALADDQRNSNPPPAAEELNTLVADALQNFSNAINNLADAGEANDAAAITAAGEEFVEASKVFDPDGEARKLEQALEAACPVLKTLGDN
jgi:hypothetical protein